MPELTTIHLGLLAAMIVVGIVLGWIIRGGRCAREKTAVNVGWQAQIDAQQSENDRLAGQNKSLMEQISQYQASIKDSNMRAKELSDSLKEAFERRDELQRQLKEIRGNLEVAVAQRDRLQTDVRSRDLRGEATESALKEKDEKIFRLRRELSSWQQRVPPLVDRFRERDRDARALEEQLQAANERLRGLQGGRDSDTTRIEPVDSESLPEGLDASNEPHSATSVNEAVEIEDQVADFDEGDGADAAAQENDESASGEYSGAYSGSVGDSEDPDEREVDGDAPGDELQDDGADLADSSGERESPPGAETSGEHAALNDHEVAGDGRDDLQLIKGVGPAIEKTLNDLGICRFNQIAEMSEYDIDRVAQQLKGFRTRIYREDWIGQARLLQYRKNNDPDRG